MLGDVVHPAIQGKTVVEKAGVRGVGREDGRGFAEEVAEEDVVVEERPGEVGVDGSDDFGVDVGADRGQGLGGCWSWV